jgi:hypothetical protein
MALPAEMLLGRLSVEFFGEDALDYGGVARCVVSLFWFYC